MSEKPATEQDRRAKAARRNGAAGRGWTVPGPIDQEEASKGTAAAHPVLVLTPEGNVAGVRLDGPGADAGGAGAARDTRSPAEIEAEIDRTREHLAATLDELSERLSPRSLARTGGRTVKAQFVDAETGRPRTARVAALAGGVGAVVGGLLALRGLRKRD
jgi:hypothetical protein